MPHNKQISKERKTGSRSSVKPISIISEYPCLNFNDFFKKNEKDGIFKVFYKNDVSLFYLGRGALFHAIKLLKLTDSDNILVPSYHCGVDIESILMAGLKVRYYKINKNMEIDIDDLCNKVDKNSKALMVTHYFGFPQLIDKLMGVCQKKKLFLIEDCAHALFSSYQGKPLGTFGDISIFSQRKTLPLPDGGALLVSNSNLIFSSDLKMPSRLITLKKTIGMLYHSRFKNSYISGLERPIIFFKNIINNLLKKEYGNEYSTGMENDISTCNLATSHMSNSIMNRSQVDSIIQLRRYNYKYLLDNLPDSQHVKVIYDNLPEGVCPLFFPVRIESINRGNVADVFRQSGIHTYIFGENLHKSLSKIKFPDAEKLSNQILCLPVHQNIQANHLKLMLKVINSINF